MITAVLLSGGLDSAVLVGEETSRGDVQPIYIRVGLAWESLEYDAAARFLSHASFASTVRPLVTLSVDMTDVYPAAHWALRGQPPVDIIVVAANGMDSLVLEALPRPPDTSVIDLRAR